MDSLFYVYVPSALAGGRLHERPAAYRLSRLKSSRRWLREPLPLRARAVATVAPHAGPPPLLFRNFSEDCLDVLAKRSLARAVAGARR